VSLNHPFVPDGFDCTILRRAAAVHTPVSARNLPTNGTPRRRVGLVFLLTI
jgi:hypothetical protein